MPSRSLGKEDASSHLSWVQEIVATEGPEARMFVSLKYNDLRSRARLTLLLMMALNVTQVSALTRCMPQSNL